MLETDKSIRLYSEVATSKVSWMWQPFIPFGKLTLIQGDPGEGKSIMILNIAAVISQGGKMPGGFTIGQPRNVIYQCSEDNVEDTIKPRLISAGADCSRIAFISEELDTLTLSDDRLKTAISDFNASLVIIDPFQAYIGDSDISNAISMRRILHKLGIWASTFGCAIVLVGHLNKKEGSRSLYRGLGSIDVVAASRSILQIGHIDDDPKVRYIKQIKNSLTKKGEDIFFHITEEGRVQWIPIYKNEYKSKGIEFAVDERLTKQASTAGMLRYMLSQGPMEANQIIDFFKTRNVSTRTIAAVKKEIGIISFRKDGRWFWILEDRNHKL